jgi:transcriptional regulator with XRE-family HTH domain
MSGTCVSEQIREIVISDGWTISRIARGTRIAKERISRFLNGRRGLEHRAFDELLTYLGLEVRRGPNYFPPRKKEPEATPDMLAGLDLEDLSKETRIKPNVLAQFAQGTIKLSRYHRRRIFREVMWLRQRESAPE